MSQPLPFDPEGRLICWECNGPTVALTSKSGGAPENYGKAFYKCEIKPLVGCKKFFRWQSQVDVLRAKHGVLDPDAPQGQETGTVPPTTTTTTAALTRSSSEPTPSQTRPSESLTQLSSSQPTPTTSGRTRPPIDLHAPPVVTPQRHLSRQNTLDVAAADPPTTAITTPRRERSHVVPDAEAEPAYDGVETVATDDEYERVISPRQVERTPTRSGGRVYPALPPSTSRRARERMPGTYTSSSDASGPTLPPSERRVHEWLNSPRAPMPERRDDIFSASPPPTQDAPPSLAPSSQSRGASTASRMHGLLRDSSPSPSQGTVRTIRLSELDAPSESDAPVDAALVAGDVMRLGRELERAQARARDVERQNRELRAERAELLNERAAMRALLTQMESNLEALRKRRGA